MFKNFLKITLRGIKKNRFYSFISVLCLVTGLTTFLVMMNYIYFEKSYDTFNKDAKDIYRFIYKTYKGGELYQNWSSTCGRLGPAFKDNFPEVIDYVRIRDPQINAGEHVVSYNNLKYREDLIYFVDSSFFNIFSYKLKRGNPKGILSKVKSVVITESIARKYFGDEDPIGKMLNFKHKNITFPCIVTGVVDIPANSHLKFDMLVPMEAFFLENSRALQDNWSAQNFCTYVKFKPGTSVRSLKESLGKLVDQNTPEWKKKTCKVTFELQPLLDIYLKSDSFWEIAQTGNRVSLYFIFILGVITLIISWVNYINFSTSRVIEKAKEVAIRKILGSSRVLQIIQFFIESCFFNLATIILSLLLSVVLLPFINGIIGKDINFCLFSNASFFLVFLGIIVVGTFLTSLYPILMISSFAPLSALKGRESFGHSKVGGFFRKMLVGFQFIVSLCIIIGTFTIILQIRYMKSQNLGFNKEGLIVIRGPIMRVDSTYLRRLKTFKSECERLANIEKVTVSSETPGKQLTMNTYFLPAKSNDANSGESLMQVLIDDDFFKTYGIELLAGRNFSKELEKESNSVIINEAALSRLRLQKPEDAFGQLFINGNGEVKIIGVVKNYRQESLKVDYSPTAFYANIGYVRPYFISVRLSAGSNAEETISSVKQKWDTYFPETPIDYYFMDTFFNTQYADDTIFIKVFTILAVISILLSCLGIFGLTYLDTSKLTKEIGIRKVMGASVENILFLLIKNVLKLIAAAVVIGLPIAYFVMDGWLQNYINRITMPWFAFFMGSFALLMITILTVGYHTVKAALQNPVNSLKEE
ncbi:MAG: ABC transporter permease [Bacteroidales bacterium]|nr:ABC transporter permease [Bacteroidales bacterium]